MRHIVVFLAAILIGSCGAYRAAPPSVVLGLQQHQLSPDRYTLVGDVQGKECGWSILYFLAIDPASSMEAYYEAMRSKRADFILEPRTELELRNYVFYQSYCVHVWGLGAKLK